MKTKQEILWQAHQLNLYDGFINQWQALFEEVLEPLSDDLKILEFGSQNSRFLQFAYLHCKYQKAVGLFLKQDGLKDIEYWNVPKKLPISYFPEQKISMLNDKFDLAVSVEVFSLMNENWLKNHAKQLFDVLTDNGVYYATMGWHSDNPYLFKHKQIKMKNNELFYEYSLDDITEIFEQVGFEVCIKRLTLPYGLVYDRSMMQKRFDTVWQMMENYQMYQVLFLFRKWQ